MTGKLRQLVWAGCAAAVVYLLSMVTIAGTAHLMLLKADVPWWFVFVCVPAALASGMLPALVLYAFRIRSWIAYVANAFASAALGTYAFLFNYSVAENLGAILVPLPKNGRDAADGMIFVAPPFSRTLADVFRDFPPLVWECRKYFDGIALIALVVGLTFGGLFWLVVVRRAAKRERHAV